MLYSLPGAIEALVALGDTSTDAEVQVEDGQPVEDIQKDVLAIALTDDETDVVIPVEPATLANDNRETYDVQCLIRAQTGDTEIKPVRDRAFAILRAFETAIKADQTLGGVVARVRVISVNYHPSRIPNTGVTVTLTFRVRIEAFTS